MNSLENQYMIELFKRYLPKVCDFISENNTYAFKLNFDNDVLSINNVNIEIEYHVKKLEAHLEMEHDLVLGKYEMQSKHLGEFPYLKDLDVFLSEIINKLNKKKMLNNIGDMAIGHLFYNHKVKDFAQKTIE
ncbi:hypothetical protein JEZ13_01605 [bacterium]|nr:hypothetical protein [bacterium]